MLFTKRLSARLQGSDWIWAPDPAQSEIILRATYGDFWRNPQVKSNAHMFVFNGVFKTS